VNVLVNTYPTREAWAADRLDPTTIGASEAAAVLGVSPFMTAWSLWEHKIERQREEGHAPQLQRGHRWEPAVLAEYADESGHRVVLPGDRFEKPGHLVTLANKLFPWLRESPDAFAIQADGVEGHAEAKTAMRANEWTPEVGLVVERWDDTHADQIPPHIAIQAYVQLAVSELPWNDVCALVPFRGWLAVRWVRILRDEDTQSQIVETLARWRNDHLVKRVPPAVDGDSACNRHLARKFRAIADRPARPCTEMEAAMAHELIAARDRMKRDDARAKELANTLIAATAGQRITFGGGAKGPYAQTQFNDGKRSIDVDRLEREFPAAYDACARRGEPFATFNLYRFGKDE
jgi:putative phage-type endonuclease